MEGPRFSTTASTYSLSSIVQGVSRVRLPDRGKDGTDRRDKERILGIGFWVGWEILSFGWEGGCPSFDFAQDRRPADAAQEGLWVGGVCGMPEGMPFRQESIGSGGEGAINVAAVSGKR